nr:hypothetical protein [Candidatus Sigynarchaeota archaeon]
MNPAALHVSIAASGRNIIPSFKPDGIIQVHGRNGVGKSMAATMLEIASGNYIFQSEGQLERLKSVIESCTISIRARDGQERFEVKLTPSTWRFNQSLNTVHPMTIGNYSYNGREIDFKAFKTKVNIRVIRGDESLTQQILFFKDIFTSKINQKMDALEKNMRILDAYKEKFGKSISDQDLRDYKQKQSILQTLLDKHSFLEGSISNREASLQAKKAQVPLLEQLCFILEQSTRDFAEEEKQATEKVTAFKADLDRKFKEKIQLEARLKELHDKSDTELQDWLDKKASLEKKLSKVRDNLQQLFDKDEFDKVISNEDQQLDLKNIRGKIDTLEASKIQTKKDLDELNLQNQRVVGINGFLARVEEYCNQVQNEQFARDQFIQLPGPGGIAKVSPMDLLEFIKKSKQDFSQDKQLKAYESKVSQFNNEIQDLKNKESQLGELEKIKKNLIALDQKIKLKGNKISDLVDKEALEAIPKRITALQPVIDDLNASIAKHQEKLDALVKDKNALDKMPSEHVFVDELKKLQCIFKEVTLAKCSAQLDTTRKEISKEEHLLEDQKKGKADIETKVTVARNDVQAFTEKLRDAGKRYGFTKPGPFIDYYHAHLEKIDTFSASLKTLSSKLQSFLKDLDAVVSGKEPRNKKNGEIIVGEFDKIFKEMYGHREFFTFVFKEYAGIKRFDIKERTIVFETKTGMEDKRDLNEFSSGEKTYAYCRAIISMIAGSAEHSIIILDESYALLDHDHSQDLYEFQKLKIKEGSIAKFINILPLKEDLEAIIEKLRSDLEKEEKIGNLASLAKLQQELQQYQ